MRVRERVVSSNHKQKGDNKEERNLWEKKEFFNANKKDKKNSSHNNTAYHRHARKNSHISSSSCVPFDDWPISRPPRRSLLPVFIKVVVGTILMPGGGLFCRRLGWRRRLHQILLPREAFTNSVGIKSRRLNRRNTSNSAKSPANWGRNSRKTGFAVSTSPKSARS